MPIAVFWDNEEHTALRYEARGKWTWEEFRSMWQVGDAMMREASSPVDLIYCAAEGRLYIPPNVLANGRYMIERDIPNYSGHSVFVDTGVLGTTIYNMLRRVYPVRVSQRTVSLVNTMAEARARMREVRALKHLTP